jgi:protoporphyrin/coproporphyrin ferrochelatase
VRPRSLSAVSGTLPGYDAILVLSFGGPEGPDEVIPFLENVLRGRDVPRSRLEEVAEHYLRFGGISPINGQNRALIAALQAEFDAHGPHLPLYWGNRNWHPLLADTLAQMRADGVERALAFVTSAYSSYSACRQYLDDLVAAGTQIGPGAPEVDKLRVYFNHPGFLEANADALRAALHDADAEAPVLFSAHSIPTVMAATSDYEAQLTATANLVAQAAGVGQDWQLVYQSRSGPPTQPWLEPDVIDAIAALPPGTTSAVVAPIGFVSDHMEVVYDLDTQAKAAAAARGIRLVRAATAGTHPAFVRMIRQLIEERLDPAAPRLALGPFGPSHDTCPAGHCPAPPRRPVAAASGTAGRSGP